MWFSDVAFIMSREKGNLRCIRVTDPITGTGRVTFINCCVSKLKSLTTCSEYFYSLFGFKMNVLCPYFKFCPG